MNILSRGLSLCLAAVLALVAASCAEHEPTLVAETEGIYLDIGGLKYQVQISRQLNPADPEDEAYFTGVPADEALADDEVYFGVFVRVSNLTEDETLPAAEHFEIVDTQGNVYEPIAVDPTINDWVYEPRDLGPGEMIPALDSAAFTGPTKGALLIFRMPVEALANRPLELEIQSPQDPDVEGIVNLDI